MKYSLGNSTVYIFPTLLKKIGFGEEGKVYKYHGKVLKIFHEEQCKYTFDIETCIKLQEITTERIILPRKTLLDKDGNFKGYTANYVYKNKYVYDIPKEKFIYEIKEIEKEIDLLSSKHIYINDWHMKNFRYDGKFKMMDPSLYRYAADDDISNIKKYNYYIFKMFIFFELIKNRLMTEMDEYGIFLNQSYRFTENDVAHFFDVEMYNQETINQYIKRIAIPHHFVI